MHVRAAFNSAGASDPGLQREINEDRYHEDPIRGLFIVVDGIGGQAAGEKAAETALSMVRTRLERETGLVEDRVREAIGLANDHIYRLASSRPEWRGMACVLTVAVASEGDVVIGHVGDTRLYKLRAGRVTKLTRDHSPVGEREDAGQLTEREAMQHPRRNEVFRDVGSEAHRPDDAGFIDVVRHPFEADAALLLCSDGLTDQVPSAAIARIVGEFAGRPREVVRALVQAANDAGGKDNVTVVYVEGPRFATAEDTRDLRALRAERRSSVAQESETVASASRKGAEHIRQDRSHRLRRWRIVAICALLLVVAGLGIYAERDRLLRRATVAAKFTPTPLIVNPGESINEAITRASAGAEVIVEPGEYRERVQMKSGVRVVSREPRGAAIRLPAGASETDAAVVAADATGAEFSGFRIVGDAATPLGIGVLVRHSNVMLSDLDITGARGAAVEYAAGQGGSIVASRLHDNPGIAIAVRNGASPRIAHNAFFANATSEHAAGTLLVEAQAHPSIVANTFVGIRPESVVVPATGDLTHLARNNWFIPPSTPEPTGRGGRGARGRR
ncbi:MAG TPA: protein phosphatase 2C domain-containing protein [Vicinamibacterales bacterium]|nr:protein phosphatase 2C domain-containing protein [Vicinamibacterales bacterium]